jgi:hypothetical protein
MGRNVFKSGASKKKSSVVTLGVLPFALFVPAAFADKISLRLHLGVRWRVDQSSQ